MSDVIGIIPGASRTFDVYGDMTTKDLVEGGLYYDSKDGRLYYYSTKTNRPNPDTGFFPIWDGSNTYVSKFSNKKYFDADVTLVDIKHLSSTIDKSTAEQVSYLQRRSDNDEILNPGICDGDNMFTQCIKGVISRKQITIVDLFDMADKRLSPEVIENYYGALMKITFMRLDKWNVWLDWILHVTYRLTVYQDDTNLIVFDYPETFIIDDQEKYSKIINGKDDPLKKIIKVLIQMKGLTKASLKTEDMDDYTINNMMTTINGPKALSAQLFSRFIRMANLSYRVEMIDNGQIVFEYHE